ncbi:uncharacterized protein FIBRA_05728 [Fibroporia radiculosa]|uniref:Uncharacterized protein n=1 Tax=Fibroporia radiculosa TaxID=599839 RepID=J4IAV9_9APHY|nr:uncharacterized protein FIBRA_05728 [Fibroporia radiculosa]CCM03591.1 predicted protein [Fibroporia radiculosa]
MTRKRAAPARPTVNPRPFARGSLPDLFARQSSQSAPPSSPPGSDPLGRASRSGSNKTMGNAPVSNRRKKVDAPPRSDQEVIVIQSSSEATHITISSDNPSHISISSDSVAPVPQKFRPTATYPSKIAPSAVVPATSPPAASISTETSLLPSTSQLRSDLSLERARRRSPYKLKSPRKRILESDSDNGHTLGEFRVPRVPPSSKGISPLDPNSSPLRRPCSKLSTSKECALPSPSDSGKGKELASPKRARLSPPYDLDPNPLSSGHEADVEELIPSSQSDEQELSLPVVVKKKNPAEIKDSVERWRKQAMIHPSSQQCSPESLGTDLDPLDHDVRHHGDGAAMDVNIPLGPPCFPGSAYPSLHITAGEIPNVPHSETEVSLQLGECSSVSTLSSRRIDPTTSVASSVVVSARNTPKETRSEFFHSPTELRQITPPMSSDSPLPVTPKILDPETKTAKIIADIKAKVLAAARSSPEEEPVDLKEIEDSSDDSDLESMDKLFVLVKGKGKAVDQSPLRKVGSVSSPLANLDSSRASKKGSPRYNMRRRSPSKHNTMTEEKLPALFSLHTSSTHRVSRKNDPLDALLREKRLADKRGNGVNALRIAEATVASSSKEKEKMVLDFDDDNPSDVDPAWADERAAMEVVRQGAQGLKLKSSSPQPMTDTDIDGSDSEETDELDEKDYEKMLGEKGGEKFAPILVKDRKNRIAKGKKRRIPRLLGMPFWEVSGEEQHGEAMQVDSLPSLPLDQSKVNGHPLLDVLYNIVVAGGAQNQVDFLIEVEIPCMFRTPALLRTAALAV